MLRQFEIALTFLTIFKTRLEPYPEMQEVGRSTWAFPVVGALIGAILFLEEVLLKGWLPSPVLAVLIVITWVFVTGGLHLDGWTDCWDALAAAVPRERRLQILKDPRLGTFGALGLFLLLALKISVLASGDAAVMSLFLAPVIGRGLKVVTVYSAQQRGQGMAAMLFEGVSPNIVKKTAVIGLAPALLMGLHGILCLFLAYVAASWFRRFAEARLGAVNGDVMGAICELSEAVFLLAASIKW